MLVLLFLGIRLLVLRPISLSSRTYSLHTYFQNLIGIFLHKKYTRFLKEKVDKQGSEVLFYSSRKQQTFDQEGCNVFQMVLKTTKILEHLPLNAFICCCEYSVVILLFKHSAVSFILFTVIKDSYKYIELMLKEGLFQ